MHKHDLNLIAALADGSLEDEARALSRVESCSDCRAEYEAQKSVLGALAVVEPAAMTEHEKAALHRDLWTELRTGAPVAQTTAPWWYRWSYAAAGLFVIIGLAALVSQMTGGGDTSAQFEETAGEIPQAEDPPASDDGASPAIASAPDTVAEATDSAALGSTAEPVDFALLAEALNETRQSAQTLRTFDESVHSDCLVEAGLADHTVIETYSLEAGDFIAVVANDAVDFEEVFFIDLATCGVVYSDS
jgi:hypothetical protein